MSEDNNDGQNEPVRADDYESQLAEAIRCRDEFASNGDYDNAMNWKKRIEELKLAALKKKKNDLKEQQEAEMSSLEEEFNQEIEKWNEHWNQKFNDIDMRSNKAEEMINERHSRELNEWAEEIEKKFPQNVKHSREFLNLLSTENNLVKQQRFEEAKVVQKKRALLEQKEIEKWNKEKEQKIKIGTQKQSNKNLQEKNIILKKFESELAIMRSMKQKEIEQIDKKFQNRKCEWEKQQKKEKIMNENENYSKRKNYNSNYGNIAHSHRNTMSANNNANDNANKENENRKEEENLAENEQQQNEV